MAKNMPIGTVEVDGRTFDLYTLPSYMTAYYYVKELGSVSHYQTVRRLQNAIKRAMNAGKLGSKP